jgi:hypothetical protein
VLIDLGAPSTRSSISDFHDAAFRSSGRSLRPRRDARESRGVRIVRTQKARAQGQRNFDDATTTLEKPRCRGGALPPGATRYARALSRSNAVAC